MAAQQSMSVSIAHQQLTSPQRALPPHAPSSSSSHPHSHSHSHPHASPSSSSSPAPGAQHTHSPSPSLNPTSPQPHSHSHSHSHPPSSTSPGDTNAGTSPSAPPQSQSHANPSNPSPSSASAGGNPSPSAGASARPAAVGSGPTNDDIEAVIQMAMASSNSPRTTNPPRDTRTQLFVGNLPYRVRWQDLKDLFRRAGTVLRADVSLGPDNRSRGYGTVLLATAEDAGRAVDMFNGYTWQTRTLEVRPDRMGEELGMPGPGPAASYGVGAGIGVGVGGVGGAGMMGVGGMGVGGLGGVGVGGMGVFGTPLLSSLSPAPGALSGGAGSPALAGAGAASAGTGLASPAPTSLARFAGAGMSPFGPGAALGEDDAAVGGGSRPGTTQTQGQGQASRNLFVGNLPFHIQWQDLKDLFRQAGAVQRADVALGADGRSRGFGTVSFANEADAERAVRMFNG
ncbi:RNA-binding domain-containing protein [Trametes cingulata]|nr:RNA-binding domain-containing protein [Trametes cingulata]